MQNIKKTISNNQNALATETKRSAGDKHETGRAMLQVEIEKAGQQFVEDSQMRETLAKIDVSTSSTNVQLGSVVETNIDKYFITIAAGKLIVADKTYFAISVSSPIGKLLLGKQQNDEFVFNEKKIKVLKVFF